MSYETILKVRVTRLRENRLRDYEQIYKTFLVNML